MKLTPNNFLSQIKNVVTGGGIGTFATNSTNGGILPDGGFRRDAQLLNAIDFSVATGVAVNSGIQLQWVHASTTGASTTVVIPREYDEESDYFLIRVLGYKTAAGSDTPTFTVAAANMNPGSTSFSTMRQVSNTSTSTIGAGLTAMEFNFSGNGLVRDSIVTLIIGAAGNTTAGQELNLLQAEMTIASCLVAFGSQTSTIQGGAGYNIDQFGNELR